MLLGKSCERTNNITEINTTFFCVKQFMVLTRLKDKSFIRTGERKRQCACLWVMNGCF